jgi:predicted amidophosphoribosyltransferase
MTWHGGFVQVHLRQLSGPWIDGWVLDKHSLRSTYLGDDERGHPQFETVRTEVGEATFLLKYRQEWTQVEPLAKALAEHIYPRFNDIGLIVPMPASKIRQRQPVSEVAVALGKIVQKPVFTNMLYKSDSAPLLKDLHSKDEKSEALRGKMHIHEAITNPGRWNALLVDDLYDSGASMEAACKALSKYEKIRGIYVAALTWR